jgi:hypothetical protein
MVDMGPDGHGTPCLGPPYPSFLPPGCFLESVIVVPGLWGKHGGRQPTFDVGIEPDGKPKGGGQPLLGQDPTFMIKSC